MPTLIDSLVVKLGLDSKGFASDSADATKRMRSLEDQITATTKSLRDLNQTGNKKTEASKKESDALRLHLDSLKQQQKAMRRSNEDAREANRLQKESAKGYESVTSGAVKFLAVLAGAVALKEFVSDSIQANYALQRMSTNLGVSVSSLSAWGNAAKLFGGSAEDVGATFQMMRGAEYQLFRGSGAMPQVGRYYTQMGMGMGEFRKSPEEQMIDIQSHSLRTYGKNGKYDEKGMRTAYQAGIAAGIAPSLMTMILTSTSSELKESLKVLKKLAPDKEQTKEQTELLKTMVLLGAEFRKLGWDILGLFSPFVYLISGWVKKVANMDPAKRDSILAAAGIGGLGVTAAMGVLANKALGWFMKSMGAKFAAGAAGETAAGAGLMATEGEISAAAAPETGGLSLVVGLIAIVCTAVIAWLAVHWSTLKHSWADKAYNAVAHAGHSVAQAGHAAAGYAGKAWGAVSQSQAMRFFEGKGWSKAASAGLVAGFNRESGGRANQPEIGGGPGYGMAQWGPAGQAEFKKWSGHDIHDSTAQEQLEFANYQLTQGSEKKAGERLHRVTSGYEGGAVASSAYERPRDKAGEAARRGRDAQLLMGIAGASNVGPVSYSSSNPGGKTVTMTVGDVHVHSSATDTVGIARDIKGALNYEFTGNANGGLM